MNAASVTNIRTLPPPAVNSVPEAHPPPSCMPMPKMKRTDRTGTPDRCDTIPRTGWPKTLTSSQSAGTNTAA